MPLFSEARIAMLRTLVPRDVTGFCYHIISPHPVAHIRPHMPFKTPEAFEQDLRYLSKNYDLIGANDLFQHRFQGQKLPKRAALISFDDGFRECYTVARPLLKKHRLPAVFFVVTGVLDNQAMLYRNQAALCIEKLRGQDAQLYQTLQPLVHEPLRSADDAVQWLNRLSALDQSLLDQAGVLLGINFQEYLRTQQPYLTREELKVMSGEGFEIGSHGRRHVKFHDIHKNQGLMEEEIVESVNEVRRITGQERVPFAFPVSSLNVSRTFLRDMAKRHKQLSLFFDTHTVEKDDPLIVNRIWGDPSSGDASRSNLSELILSAYQEHLIGAVRFWKPRKSVSR